MSFFTSSSGFTIFGGSFTSISLPTQDAAGATQVLGNRKDCDSCESDDYTQADYRRKSRRCRSLDGLMVVKADEVDLHRELIKGIGYRIHSASHHGRLVAVKAFEGPRAKQDWTVDLAFSKDFIHSNLLKVVGVSDERSKSHFVLFHGIKSEETMQSLIAKALRTDLNMSVRISMKAVKGIAAGLSYIKSQNIPIYPGTMNNNRKWENFNIFTGYDNEPIISFDSSNTVHENGSVFQTFDDEIDGCGVEVLSGLCRQLFSGANSILYDDAPERNFDAYDREGFPKAPLECAEGTSNVSESEDMSNPSNSTEKSKSCRNPRREVWWLDLGAKNQTLESIKRRFENCLDHFLLSSSNSLLRHITSPMDGKLIHNLHQCPGYLREEITLASDVSKSAIISHAFPSQSEICSICGQLVQYESAEPSIVDGEIQEADSPAIGFSATVNAAEGKIGPQQEHLSHDGDRVLNRGGIERGPKASLRINTTSITSPSSDKRRPGPLDLRGARFVSPVVAALATARVIADIATVPYPEGYNSPHPDLNQNVKNGKFRYDHEFLLQFMSVCKERPATLPPLDAIGLEPVDHTHAMSRAGSGHRRPSSAVPPSRQTSIGLGFTPSALGKPGANNLFSMGNFGTMDTGSNLSSEERYVNSNRAASAGMQYTSNQPSTMQRTASQVGAGAPMEKRKHKENRNKNNRIPGGSGGQDHGSSNRPSTMQRSAGQGGTGAPL